MTALFENKKGLWVPIVLAVLLTAGTYGATYSFIPLSKPYFYTTLAFNILISITFFLAVDWFIAQRLHHSKPKTTPPHHHRKIHIRFIDVIAIARHPTALALNAACIFICWLPYLLLLYPGIMYWDTGDQLAQFFGISAFGMPAGQIWDHHPWFSTFLFGWLTKIGHSLTGSYTFGLMINAAIQYTIVAIELSWIVSFLSTKGLRGKGLTALCLFMCFFPPLPILCAAMSKDVINAVAFLGWIILFYRLAESGLNLLKKPSFLLSFIVVTLVVSLTKKIGMYLVIASLVALLVFHFSIKLKLAVVVFTFSLVLVCNGILPTYLYPALNIVPGGSQAALAMPIQLLARVARDYPEDITEEERTVIDSCLLFSTDEMGANYNPYITDPVTGFNTKKPIPMGSFLKIWLQVGLRHPLTYLNAFFSLESGWITFSGAPSIGTSQKIASEQYPILLEPVFCSTANKDTFGKLQTLKSQSWRQDIIEQLYRLISRLPIANIFCYVATWTSILPAFVLFEYLRRCKHDKRCLIVLIPYFISALSLFVYPVSLSAQNHNPTRYMFHMILLAPLVFGFVLTCMKAKPSNQQNTLSTHATTEPQNRQ